VQPRETPSPHGPWKHAALGTVPSPAIAKARHRGAFARPGGTASPRSGRIWGAEDWAPPGGRSPARCFQSPRTATLWSGVSRPMGGYGGLCPFRGGTQLWACCDIGHPGATACLRSASGRERGRYSSRTLPNRKALHELRQAGRCRVPAVRRMPGTGGDTPSALLKAFSAPRNTGQRRDRVADVGKHAPARASQGPWFPPNPRGATADPKRTSLGARRLTLPEALSVSNLCALCVSGV